MKSKKQTISIIEKLKETYPDCKGSLYFNNPFEIVIAVMLSAQCTDERVNRITPILFAKYSTPELMAKADLKDIEKIIKSCGFYKNKSRNAVMCSKMLVEKYNGIVPDDIEELQLLPGIGRKSANVIMLEAFHNPQGIAVDTHVKRLSNRIGFTNKKDPEKIEQDLLKVVPKEYYYDVNHLFIYHGRKICSARHPVCENCSIKDFCDRKGVI